VVKNINLKFWLVITVFWLYFSGITIAVERHVPSQYSTIQAAIDDCNDGDVVIVAPGTYTGNGNRDIDFRGKAITVSSINPNDPNIVATTVIDCEGGKWGTMDKHRGFVFYSSEGNNSALLGVTISNGLQNEGAGIYCSASPTIANCIVTVCSTESRSYNGGGGIHLYGSNAIIRNCTITRNFGRLGGGIHCTGGSPIINNCTITRNDADTAGGFYCRNSNPIIDNCIIEQNTSGGHGSGIYCNEGNHLTINNSFIANNSGASSAIYSTKGTLSVRNCRIEENSGSGIRAYLGDISISHCNIMENIGHGIYRWGKRDSTIRNCIITSNSSNGIYSASSYPAIYNCTIIGNLSNGIYSQDNARPTIKNCIIWDNAGSPVVGKYITVTYSDIENSWPGEGNINSDPMFVNPDSNDFHLLPDSPCVNMGDPNYVPGSNETDIDGDPRIFNGRIDIGADEWSIICIYVDTDATGNNDGSSWEDAYNYLQDALADANSSPKPLEIRVAQGIYKPDEDTLHPDGTGNREATFQLINGVTLKGGYAGFGEPEPNARDIDLHETILSGDLNGDDGPNFANNSENSYDVVTGSGTDELSVLDGFIITAGNATNGSTWDNLIGGGMYISYGRPTLTNCTFRGNSAYCGGGTYNSNSNPTVTNCTFTGNSAEWEGGGMYNFDNSNPIVTNCTFTGNSVDQRGGGIYNNKSSPTLTNCTFTGNSVDYRGGGIYNYKSSPTLTNCTFSENSTEDNGGGIYNYKSSPTLTNCTFSENSAEWGGGGMCNSFESSPTITNCTFNNNSADLCGGMLNVSHSNPTITNCTFSGNLAERGGGMINGENSNPTITNCTFSGNAANIRGGGMYNLIECSPTITNCTFNNNSAGVGGGIYNYKSSPILTNCILWSNIASSGSQIYNDKTYSVTVSYSDTQGGYPGTGNINADPCFVNPDGNDFHLLPDSPCIDAGDPTSYFGLEPEPDGGRINMGAYGNTPEATCKAGLVLQSYNLISKTRIGRTEFEYVYSMTLNNNSDEDVSNVIVELLDAPNNVTILDANVSFAYIEAGAPALSDDTFSIIVDRAAAVDAAIISWRATYDLPGVGGAGLTAFTTSISLNDNPSDINGDEEVNLEDLEVLAEQWLGPPGEPSADIAPEPDGDGIIDFLDFALFAENWRP